MSAVEAIVTLEPFGAELQALVERIEATVADMDTARLEGLLLSCSVVERTAPDDVRWATARVRPLVERIARIEMDSREARAALREAINL